MTRCCSNELIGTLGGLGHPATLAEANRRFAANDPSVQAGPLRSTILGIVAYNADEADLGAAAADGARRAQPAGARSSSTGCSAARRTSGWRAARSIWR